jgi:hypothetical protein
MDISALIPPPAEVRRRAWECAFVLCQDFRPRLARHEAERLAWLVATGPDRLTWAEIREAMRLHASHVAVRP